MSSLPPPSPPLISPSLSLVYLSMFFGRWSVSDHHMKPHTNRLPHLMISLLLLTSTLITGCWEKIDNPLECDPNLEECRESNMCEEGEECNSIRPVAHKTSCLSVDGPLCLQGLEWEDQEARLQAITPGEEILLKKVTLYNASEERIDLNTLNVSSLTAEIQLTEGALHILDPSGEVSRELLPEGLTEDEVNAACDQGTLMPLSGCELSLDLAVHVLEEAPVNQNQQILLSTGSQLGSGFELSLPFLVIDPNRGLSLDRMELDDSSRDGELNPGDRVRLSRVLLKNHSLAPFGELTAHLSSNSPWIDPTSAGEMWVADGVGVRGVETDVFTQCRAAESTDSPSTCEISFSQTLEIQPDAPIGEEIELSLRFKEYGEDFGEPIVFTFILEELEVDLSFSHLNLSADQNHDLLVSPGEVVTFNEIHLRNEGASSLSLRGRLSTDSPYVSIRTASNVSVDLSREDDFYERCGGEGAPHQERGCMASTRIRVEISDEIPVGESVPFTLSLIDHLGSIYELTWELNIVTPDVRLDLQELGISQDTYDTQLSGGETGVISYLKLINEGRADAFDLTATISTDSDYVTFQDLRSLTFDLHSMGSEDDQVGDCLSTQSHPEAYCYQRLNINFQIDPQIPLGERVLFFIDLVDRFGQEYTVSDEIIIF